MKMIFSARVELCLSLLFIAAIGTAQTVKGIYSFPDTMPSYGGTAPLVQGRNGMLYGTTTGYGRAGFVGATVFNALTGRGHSVLHSFDISETESLQAGLTLASDGNFYGVTLNGGDLG